VPRKIDAANTSLLALCAAAAGGRWRDAAKGTRVCLFIVQWSMTAHELEREPTVTEYIEAGWEKERSAWRHLAEFRELFPQLDTPQPFVPLLPATDDVAAALTAAGRVAVPADLVPA
jgi:hypothetical protein